MVEVNTNQFYGTYSIRKTTKHTTMKWNHGIAAALLLFIAMMSYLIVQSTRAHIDLVTPDYYQEELKHEERMEQKRNALQWGNISAAPTSNDGFTVSFPDSIVSNQLVGELTFYDPADSKNDFTEPLHFDETNTHHAKKKKKKGKRNLQLHWNYNGKEYFVDKIIYFE